MRDPRASFYDVQAFHVIAFLGSRCAIVLGSCVPAVRGFHLGPTARRPEAATSSEPCSSWPNRRNHCLFKASSERRNQSQDQILPRKCIRATLGPTYGYLANLSNSDSAQYMLLVRNDVKHSNRSPGHPSQYRKTSTVTGLAGS